MKPKSTPTFVRFKQVCEELDMSTDTGYAHVRAGTFPIPTVRVGSILKARRSDLDRFKSGEPSDAEQKILAQMIVRTVNDHEPITLDALAAAGSTDPQALIEWAAANGYLYGGDA